MMERRMESQRPPEGGDDEREADRIQEERKMEIRDIRGGAERKARS